MSEAAQDAWHTFEAVGIMCSFFFGIPLALVTLRMVSGLFGSPLTAPSYIDMELYKDLAYAVILAGLTIVPILATYVQYRKLDQ